MTCSACCSGPGPVLNAFYAWSHPILSIGSLVRSEVFSVFTDEKIKAQVAKSSIWKIVQLISSIYGTWTTSAQVQAYVLSLLLQSCVAGALLFDPSPEVRWGGNRMREWSQKESSSHGGKWASVAKLKPLMRKSSSSKFLTQERHSLLVSSANGWAGPHGSKAAKPADLSQKLTLVMGHVYQAEWENVSSHSPTPSYLSAEKTKAEESIFFSHFFSYEAVPSNFSMFVLHMTWGILWSPSDGTPFKMVQLGGMQCESCVKTENSWAVIRKPVAPGILKPMNLTARPREQILQEALWP